MLYLILKFIHIMAVILFLGNIITGLFWKLHADNTRDPRVIAHAFEGIIRSDRIFTIPGTIFIIAAGVATALIGQLPILGTGWILWAIILFSLSGLAFGLRVAPLQEQLAHLAREGAETDLFDWERYRRLAHIWEMWGLVSLLTPVGAVILMVLKPSLPAF
jgi:uncharacterized membrane protein